MPPRSPAPEAINVVQYIEPGGKGNTRKWVLRKLGGLEDG